MIFTGFYINGYGIFRDQLVKGLSPRIVLFVGRNEAGKSTCLSFFRHILFGFPDKRSKTLDPDHPPLRGGSHGGSLFMQTRQLGNVVLERYKSPKNKKAVLTLDDGSQGTMDDLKPLLGGITSRVYRNVYAFSLTELQNFETLQDEQVRGALYGAAIGSGLQDLPSIRQRLQAMAKNLFVPRGHKPIINQLLRDLESVGKEIKVCSRQLFQYKEAKAKAAMLFKEIEDLRLLIERLEKRQSKLSLFAQVWDDFLRKEMLERQLDGLDKTIESFPSDGLARLDSLIEQRNDVKSLLAELDEEALNISERIAKVTKELNEAILSKEAQIRELHERSREALKAEKNLSSLMEKRKGLQSYLDRILSSLGPAWDEESLKAFTVSLAIKKKIDDWENQMSQAEKEVEQAKALLSEKERQWEQATERLRELKSQLEPLKRIEQIVDKETYELLHTQFGLFQTNISRLESKKKNLASIKQEKEKVRSRIIQLEKQIPGGVKDKRSLSKLRQDLGKVGMLNHAMGKLARDEEHIMALASEKEFQKALLEEKLDQAPLGFWKWVLPALGLAAAEVLAFYLLLARDEFALGGIIFTSALAAAAAYWKIEHKRELWLQEQNSQIEKRLLRIGEELKQFSQRLSQNQNEQVLLKKELQEVCNRAGLPEHPKEHDLFKKTEELDQAAILLDSLDSLFRDLQALNEREEELEREKKILVQRIDEYVGLAKKIKGISGRSKGNPWELLVQLPNFFNKYKEIDALIQKKCSLTGLVDEAERLAQEAKDAFEDASLRLKVAEQKMDHVLDSWRYWLQELGLDEGFSPSTAREALQKIEQGQQLIAESSTLEQAANRDKDFVEAVKEDAMQLFAALNIRCRHTMEFSDIFQAVGELNKKLEQGKKAQIQKEGLQERFDQVSKKIKGNKAKIAQLEDTINSLLSEAGAEDIEDFRRLAGWFDRQTHLLEELEKTNIRLSMLDPSDSITDLFKEYGDKKVLLEELDKIGSDITELKDKEKGLYEEYAKTEHLVKELSTSERMDQLKFDRETIRQKLFDNISKWARYTLALQLLDEARHRFEVEKQPKILQDAGRFFSIITGGRYEKIVASPAGDDLEVIDSKGSRKQAVQLSRGTAEQLYLALRFGYILNYGLRSEPLPVIMDDILVNFDPERAENTIETIIELSKTHQVLFFTCHPETLGKFEARLPGVQQLVLEEGKIVG